MNDQKELLSDLVASLNDALRRDPAAVSTLLGCRVACTDTLADHPTIVVEWDNIGKYYTISPLGLLNGVVEIATGAKIAAMYEDYKLIGFTVYEPKE